MRLFAKFVVLSDVRFMLEVVEKNLRQWWCGYLAKAVFPGFGGGESKWDGE